MSVKMVTLDISSKKTGACLTENGSLKDYTLLDYSSITETEERMKEMGKAIIDLLNQWQPSIIYVEDTWSARNAQVSKLLTRLLGVSYGWAISHDCEWNAILPSRWRSLAGMSIGKKKREELKQMSIDYAFEQYGVTVNDDVADAIGIAASVFNYYSSLQILD